MWFHQSKLIIRWRTHWTLDKYQCLFISLFYHSNNQTLDICLTSCTYLMWWPNGVNENLAVYSIYMYVYGNLVRLVREFTLIFYVSIHILRAKRFLIVFLIVISRNYTESIEPNFQCEKYVNFVILLSELMKRTIWPNHKQTINNNKHQAKTTRSKTWYTRRETQRDTNIFSESMKTASAVYIVRAQRSHIYALTFIQHNIHQTIKPI